MIADKIYPSFYVIELEGKAISTFIPGDFGIDKIAIGSHDFKTDLEALSGLTDAMQHLASNLEITDNISEEIDFNPEFFPTLKPIKLTKEQKENQIKTQEKIDGMKDQLEANNQTAIALTTIFDPLGDFVETRWTIKSPELKMEGKVAINPEYYIMDKQRSQGIKNQDKVTIH